MDLYFHKHNFPISAEWVFLQQAITNVPAIALLEH